MKDIYNQEEQEQLSYYKYKEGKLIFSLPDEEYKERKVLWDNQEKKFIKIGETFRDVDGDEHEVKEELFFKKTDDFNKLVGNEKNEKGEWKFPPSRMSRIQMVTRKVNINGVVYMMDFKPQAHVALLTTMDIVRKMGNDVTKYYYELSKTGEKAQTKYTVTIGGGVKDDGQVVHQTFQPTQNERAFIKAFDDGSLPNKINPGEAINKNKTGFVAQYVANNGDEARADLLWDCYVKGDY